MLLAISRLYNRSCLHMQSELQSCMRLRYTYTVGPKNNQPNKGPKPAKQQNDQQAPPVTSSNQKLTIKPPKGTRDFLPKQMAIRRHVIDKIAQVFRKHGAVEIDTPVFELKDVLTGKYGEDSKLIYDLEDQGGEKCSLRYDLTVPFARFMANHTNIQKIKRFHIGKVYRRDQPTANKGRFRQFYQCDFDIAGKYEPMLPDAQVLAIMQQVLETVGVGQFVVKLNHRKILQALVDEAGCAPESFKAICSTIDKLDKCSWEEVREELIKAKGVTQAQAKVIGELIKIKGSPDEVLERLMAARDLVRNDKQLRETYDQLKKLFSYMRAMKCLTKVRFDLSLARGLDYYTGIIFQIVLTSPTSQLGSISGGGRYDDLIGMFSQYQIPSVGGSIGIERIFAILEEQYVEKVRQNESEVLVVGIGNVPVEKRLEVMQMLWQAGVKAEV